MCVSCCRRARRGRGGSWRPPASRHSGAEPRRGAIVRIAVIAPPWVPVPPPAYGGTEAVLDCLARGLRDAGHEVLLFATGDSTCDVPIRWAVEVAPGTAKFSPATAMHHVLRGYAAAVDWGADAVHDHTIVGPLAGVRTGLPIVVTNHSPFDTELRTVFGAIAGAGIAIIAISRHQASTAAGIPIAAVIHHGLDVGAVPLGEGTT